MPEMNKRVLTPTTLEELKVGQVVQVTEVYPQHTTVITGAVTYINGNTITIGDRDKSCYDVWVVDADRTSVNVYVDAPPLPTKVGTVIKWFDPEYLEDTALIRVGYTTRQDRWWSARRLSDVKDEQVRAGEWTLLFEPEH